MYAVFLCGPTTDCEAYSATTDGYRICNCYTNLGACCTHEGGPGTSKSCTKVDSEGQKNCLSSCPARGSNPGSLDLNSDSLTAEPCPPLVRCRNIDIDVDGCSVAVSSSVGQTRCALLAKRAYHQCWRVMVRIPSGSLDFLL